MKLNKHQTNNNKTIMYSLFPTGKYIFFVNNEQTRIRRKAGIKKTTAASDRNAPNAEIPSY